ncbi:MAG: AmmeMemoRadiSam system protein B [Anaerolineales bacterium]|nr:AmmeMemoRadiSam system protein B [Anaerolineales bacterium]
MHGSDLFTLTRQNYATPYGVLPTDTELVDRLAAQLGEDLAYAGELRHRGEHSLELVVVWLHHMRAGRPVALAPILVGSFHPFYTNGRRPLDDVHIQKLLKMLGEITADRRTLIIASGDLAHVGPAFGGAPLDREARQRLRAADDGTVAAMSMAILRRSSTRSAAHATATMSVEWRRFFSPCNCSVIGPVSRRAMRSVRPTT